LADSDKSIQNVLDDMYIRNPERETTSRAYFQNTDQNPDQLRLNEYWIDNEFDMIFT
jgi:hypothetical protein